MANEVLNAIERNLRAFRHVSQELEPTGQELGSTWYIPSTDMTYKWVNNAGVYEWEMISGNKTVVAVVDPVIADDLSAGIEIGTLWINTATEQKFTMYDETIGAAIWKRDIDVNGDEMAGALLLYADPVANMEATTKQYVDAVAAVTDTEAVQDIVGDMFNVPQNGVIVSYDDPNGKITINVNDPVLAISGAATGFATMTDLGNTTINTTISSINNISDVATAGSVVGDVLIRNAGGWVNTDVLDPGTF